jgi:hypothetical protein
MATYSISYDLRQPGRDYKKLLAAIESYGTYYHCLESTWLIRTSDSAIQVRDRLMQFMDANDALLVTKLSGEAAWYGLPNDGSTWIQQQIAA